MRIFSNNNNLKKAIFFNYFIFLYSYLIIKDQFFSILKKKISFYL
jgi:hypothetical protein